MIQIRIIYKSDAHHQLRQRLHFIFFWCCSRRLGTGCLWLRLMFITSLIVATSRRLPLTFELFRCWSSHLGVGLLFPRLTLTLRPRPHSAWLRHPTWIGRTPLLTPNCYGSSHKSVLRVLVHLIQAENTLEVFRYVPTISAPQHSHWLQNTTTTRRSALHKVTRTTELPKPLYRSLYRSTDPL